MDAQVAGVLFANDTWPDAAWVFVLDDDNRANLATVRRYLDDVDSDVPLLLAGQVGPGHNSIPCRGLSNATHWSCCTDVSAPCYARLYGPQHVWALELKQ